jgi:hypothetical protein
MALYQPLSPCCALQAHLADAEIWMGAQEYEQAVASTGKLLKSQPGHLQALVLRGTAYYYLNGTPPALLVVSLHDLLAEPVIQCPQCVALAHGALARCAAMRTTIN